MGSFYRHYSEELVLHNEDQMHHNGEHQKVIAKMVRDYLVHHDQANQNLTNVVLDEIHLSVRKKKKVINKKLLAQSLWD